ncbi:MAG: hypothetical protein JO290_13840 [Sphingomonadaceae bacterium]|nr:hypothetical protein [Sphingomonadaceae bacterium]
MPRPMIAALMLLAAVPGSAQTAPATGYSSLKPAPADTSLPRQKLVTVFGTDPCPKSTDPDEIIVCTRRPDEDRYRIPPTVRSDVKPDGPFEGTNRKALLGDATGGAGGGIGSCSAVGPGGGTGCNQAIQDQYRAARKAGQVPQAIVPEITPGAPVDATPK